jgi:hypothetical protein
MSTALTTIRLYFGLGYLGRYPNPTAHPIIPLQKVVDLWLKNSDGFALGSPLGYSMEHIFDLVSDFHAYECSNGHDRIFAVHALSHNNNAQTEIDYDLGISETFARFACACMADDRLMDVLDASIARIDVPSAIDTPSWAPDWTRKPGPFTKFTKVRRDPMITYLSQVRENVIKLSVRRLSWYHLNSEAEETLPNSWILCTEPLVLRVGSPYSLLRAVIRLYQKSDTKNVRNPDSLRNLLIELWADPEEKTTWVYMYGNTLPHTIKHIWDASDESDE